MPNRGGWGRIDDRHTRMEILTRGASGSTVTWTSRAERWAALVMLTGTEQLEAKKLIAGRSGRATFAYDEVTVAITPKDRLRVLGTARVFDVKDVINVEERNREVEVAVIEQVL